VRKVSRRAQKEGRRLLAALALLLASSLSTAALAQSTVQVGYEENHFNEAATVLDEFEDAYFTFDRIFYQNRRFPRSLAPVFGLVEREISGDGHRVHRLYQEVLEQQIMTTDLIRVADLPSPFTGSLGTTPLYVEEPIPAAPLRSDTAPPVQATPPRGEPPASPRSIPALW
jgi:hypothetical protein